MRIPGGERIIEVFAYLKALNYHGVDGTRRLSNLRPSKGHVHPDWKGHDMREEPTPLDQAMQEANDNIV